jgi:hypothetical protein
MEAEKQADARVRECVRLAERHCWSEFLRLLEDFPVLALNPDVQQGLERTVEYRRLRRGPGRPAGSFACHPLWIVGLVQRQLDAGRATNNEAALRQVAQLCDLPFSSVRSAFYCARDDARFQPLLLKLERTTNGQAATAGTAADQLDLLQRAELLTTGANLTRTIEHAALGKVELSFHGLPSIPRRKRKQPIAPAEQLRNAVAANPFLYGHRNRNNN